LIAVWIGLNQSSVVARECIEDCVGIGTPNEHLQAADVVFAGKAIAVNETGWRINGIGFERRPPFIHFTKVLNQSRMTLEVATVWKGEIPAKISVIQGAYCGTFFVKDEEYIVYAKWFKGELATGPCMGNNKLRDAGEDLAAFGSGKPPTSLHAAYIGRLIVVLMLLSILVGLSGKRVASMVFRDHEQAHPTS
jgi:hypothetical protein